MAVLSDYTSGTISLANGSATVTGTGTLFEVTRFREGDTLQIQNLTAVIASVDSDTQLTLTEPWTGTSIVDGPYRARQLADGTRVGTQAATLIELLGDGTLAGIAALGVEEGKVPVGGPAGQYVLADLVQDPNDSLGKLAALTLAARQILQTDATGALKTIALAANKLLNTDANGDLLLSDITAKGRSLVAASSNDAALAVIAAAARPATSGRGLFASFQTAPGAAAVLPSGGTYAFWLVAYEAASGQFRNGFAAGVSAGGSTIGTAVSGWIWSGVYWNLT
ncbi:hypothetical protein [Brucella anthropi]|uniref:hypothetical protein n=1 Tax=Brucella anthropi TaxID=529 RepID=UPI003D97831A